MIPIKLSLGAQVPQAQCDGKPTKTIYLEFYGGFVAVGTFYPGIFYSIWRAPENLLSSLGILL